LLPNRDDRFGQRISPITSAAATNQLDVVRGINCARVKSGRSRSPTAVDELRSMSSVAPTPGRKPTERALDLIDDDTDATEIRFDLLLRQDRVLRRAGRFSTLVAGLRRRGWNGVCSITVIGLVSPRPRQKNKIPHK